MNETTDIIDRGKAAADEWYFGHKFVDFAKNLRETQHAEDRTINRQFATKLSDGWSAACLVCVGPSELVAKDMDFATTADQRDELRDLCVLLFDAVKHGNQVTDLPALWNKAEEVLKRTAPEKQ